MKNKFVLSALVCALCFTSSSGMKRTISSHEELNLAEGTFSGQVFAVPVVNEIEVWAEFTPTGDLTEDYHPIVKESSVSVIVNGEALFEIRASDDGDFVLDAIALGIYSNSKILCIPEKLLRLASIKATGDLLISPSPFGSKWRRVEKGEPVLKMTGCYGLSREERKFICSLPVDCCWIHIDKRSVGLEFPKDEALILFVRDCLASTLGEKVDRYGS